MSSCMNSQEIFPVEMWKSTNRKTTIEAKNIDVWLFIFKVTLYVWFVFCSTYSAKVSACRKPLLYKRDDVTVGWRRFPRSVKYNYGHNKTTLRSCNQPAWLILYVDKNGVVLLTIVNLASCFGHRKKALDFVCCR